MSASRTELITSPLMIFGSWIPWLVFRIISPLQNLNLDLKYLLAVLKEEVDFGSSKVALGFVGEAVDFGFKGESGAGGGSELCFGTASLLSLSFWAIRLSTPIWASGGITMPESSPTPFKISSAVPLA